MKKIYTLLFSLITLSGFSQPELTYQNSGLMANTQSDQRMINGFLADPGASGPNVTWDYSDLATGVAVEIVLVPSASTTQGVSFPNANVAGDTDPVFAYIKSDNETYSNCGIYNGVAIVYYDDEEDIVRYPFTYGDAFEDELHSDFVSGVSFERSGIITVSADAYGTLILPSGTIANTLRVHYVEEYSDISGILDFEYYSDNYVWFVPGVHFPIMSITSFSANGQVMNELTQYLSDASVAIGEEAQLSWSLYPNPAEDVLVLAGVEDALSCKLLDLSGRVVLEQQITNRNEDLDISVLAPGVYVLNLNFEDRVETRKVIVK